MSPKATPWEIEAIATHVPKGQSERAVCPKCNGGTDNEKCLQVYVDQDFQFHWRCYRATCGYRGGKSYTGMPIVPSKKEAKFYTRPTVWPSTEQHELIYRRFGLPSGTVDAYCKEDDRFILSVDGPNRGNKRGVVAYSFSGAIPKALNYNETPDDPFIHWSRSEWGSAAVIVIVEDWFSAEKVHLAGAMSVALMGTLLNQKMVTEIAKRASITNSKVFLAFDKDAWPKALTYQLKYREQFPLGLKVWSLKKDLKYVPVERIERAINGETDFSRDYSQQGVL